MFKRAALTIFLTLCAGGAHAGFSLVCDEKDQLDDILRTNQQGGFSAAREKFLAYIALRNDHDEPTCELSERPDPAKVGQIVSRFDGVEFLPRQIHDVVIVEIKVGDRFVYGTVNRFVAPQESMIESVTTASGIDTAGVQ